MQLMQLMRQGERRWQGGRILSDPAAMLPGAISMYTPRGLVGEQWADEAGSNDLTATGSPPGGAIDIGLRRLDSVVFNGSSQYATGAFGGTFTTGSYVEAIFTWTGGTDQAPLVFLSGDQYAMLRVDVLAGNRLIARHRSLGTALQSDVTIGALSSGKSYHLIAQKISSAGWAWSLNGVTGSGSQAVAYTTSNLSGIAIAANATAVSILGGEVSFVGVGNSSVFTAAQLTARYDLIRHNILGRSWELIDDFT